MKLQQNQLQAAGSTPGSQNSLPCSGNKTSIVRGAPVTAGNDIKATPVAAAIMLTKKCVSASIIHASLSPVAKFPRNRTVPRHCRIRASNHFQDRPLFPYVREKMGNLRKTINRRLGTEAKNTTAMLTHFLTRDMITA